jgi:Carboxypeptidase regulatory-like domain
MNPAFRRLILFTLLLVTSLPVLGNARNRAVQPLPLVAITGIVTDRNTNRPVVLAEVLNGTRSTTTGADGRFTIEVPSGRPTILVIRRSGYETSQIPLTVPASGGVIVSPAPPGAGSGPIAIALAPKPTVRVTEVNGTVYDLDIETMQFAYAIPFSGYARSDRANLCSEDGRKIEPHKTEITKITGPATPFSKADCCQVSPILGVTIELKAGGGPQRVYFNDSCFGSEVDLIGRDHASAQFVYLNWINIREVVFP